jgi:hypothetical protein
MFNAYKPGSVLMKQRIQIQKVKQLWIRNTACTRGGRPAPPPGPQSRPVSSVSDPDPH